MTPEPRRLNRREALARVATAAAVLKTLDFSALGAPLPVEPGIGTDPNLLEKNIPWARVLTPAELRAVAALADTFLPADPPHPSASEVGVPDFIDEWVSAPYQDQRSDQKTVREGLAWFDRAARARHGKDFTDLTPAERAALFQELADGTAPGQKEGFPLYQKLRQLVMGGYFSTPQGWADIGFVGNRPIGGDWPGPPKEILEKLGLVAP